MLGEPLSTSFSANVRKIRDAVALAGMNGLGESQLAEMGLAMNRGTAALVGLNQVKNRVVGEMRAKWRGLELTPEQARDSAFLRELEEISTIHHDMHHLARNNVHFDTSLSATRDSAVMKGVDATVDTLTGGKYRPVMQYLQSTHTGYASIRAMQEELAMSGLMHDVGKKLNGLDSFTSDARLADIGIPMDLLRAKLKSGDIQLNEGGSIKTLGIENWTPNEQHSLGVALQRHVAQQVQRGFTGESSALMQNPWMAFMMQFQSYPTIAVEKQQMRNIMFHDKEAAMGITLNTFSSAGARMLRYYSLSLGKPAEDREAYLDSKFSKLGEETFAYMGVAGMLETNYRIANKPSEITPAFYDWAGNYMKAAEGLEDGVQSKDVGNIASAIPLGTIAQMNIIMGAIRTLMSSDDSGSETQNRNRGD